MLNVHHDRIAMNDMDVFEADIRNGGRTGLRADLHGTSPIAPQHAVFGIDVAHRKRGVAGKTFDDDTVVVVAQVAVAKHSVGAVGEIAAVGIVTPHADKLDIIDGHVGAACKMRRPRGGIDNGNALHPHVFRSGEKAIGEPLPRSMLELSKIP